MLAIMSVMVEVAAAAAADPRCDVHFFYLALPLLQQPSPEDIVFCLIFGVYITLHSVVA